MNVLAPIFTHSFFTPRCRGIYVQIRRLSCCSVQQKVCWFAGSQLRQKCRNRFRLHFCSTLRLRQNSASLFFSRFPVKLGFALKVRKNYSGVASGCARSCPRTSPLQGCLLVKDRCFFQDEVLDSFSHQFPAHSLFLVVDFS